MLLRGLERALHGRCMPVLGHLQQPCVGQDSGQALRAGVDMGSAAAYVHSEQL